MFNSLLKTLLDKPNVYLLVWSYVYANTNNGYGEIDVTLLCSRCKVPKTTLRRIISYGVKGDNGFNVDCKWFAKSLIISIDGATDGSEMVSKWFQIQSNSKPKKVKKPKVKKEPKTLFPLMIKRYDEFIKEKTDLGAKINAQEGKAMKNILAYLKSQVINKGDKLSEKQVEENTLLSWDIILSNWDLLKGWNKENLKLSQIDSNLINIISEIKNNKSNIKHNKRDERFKKAHDQLNSF